MNIPSHVYLPRLPDQELINEPVDADGNTYLHLICTRGASAAQIHDAVLNHGADPNLPNKAGIPPLGAAIRFGTPEMIEAFRSLGAKGILYLGDNRFFNAVLIAVKGGHADNLQKLVACGYGNGINHCGIDHDGKISDDLPLQSAVGSQNEKLVKILLESGALPDMVQGSANPATPLIIATGKESHKIADLLLKAGAHLEETHPVTGDTPLHIAVRGQKEKLIDFLLDQGSNINAVNNTGNTPLMLAARAGHAAIVRRLLARKPDINKQDMEKGGDTALIKAAQGGNTIIVRELLEAGADPLLRDKFNKSAAKHVEDKNFILRDILTTAENVAFDRHFSKKHTFK